jgi:hypothetical protein
LDIENEKVEASADADDFPPNRKWETFDEKSKVANLNDDDDDEGVEYYSEDNDGDDDEDEEVCCSKFREM